MTDKVAVAEALREIAEANEGRLTPEDVVEAARDEASPLHAHFTWNDGEAALKCRLAEARFLIRSVKIVVETKSMDLRVPEFIRDPGVPAEQQGYISVVRLRTDEDMSREALVAEFSRAAAALTRARALAVALELADQVDDLINSLGTLETLARATASAQAEARAH